MQLADDTLIVSASDLTGFLACHHLTALELQAAEGLVKKPHRRDPLVDLLSKKGDEHEARQLAQFKADGLTIVQVPRAPTIADLPDVERRTLQAMKDGVDVVYQATFFDGGWRGHADFLRRVEIPSDLGPYSYEVHDAKLARSPKGRAVLQLCVYSNQLARLQGTTPEWMHLILGDNSVQSFKANDYAAYYRTIDRAFDEFVAAPSATYPDPVEHCQVCRWWGNCIDRRRSDDHLSLVAGIRNDQIKKLNQAGITTLAALGTEDPARKVVGIPSVSFERLQDQAAMQVLGRGTGKPEYKILSPPGPELGLEMLPEPTKADIFFDIEGDPYVGDEGLNFLFGLTSLEKGQLAYRSWWAHTPAEEKAMVEAFLDHITAHRAAHPDMHVYHYSPAEPGALKRLVGHYATREEDLDRLLRAQVFVDLYGAVKQGIRISEESYSIKKLEAFYAFTRSDPITKESSAILEYEKWLETDEQSLLDGLEEYNRADCDTMVYLRDWLEERRAEAESQFGKPLSRPEVKETEGSEELSGALQRTADLVASLTKDVDADPNNRTDEEQACWLLAQLLGWHRREAKSGWWAYYDRIKKTPEDLVEDADSLGALSYEGVVDEHKKSKIHAFSFPAQEHKITVGSYVDPTTQSGVNVESVDNVQRLLLLRRGKSSKQPLPAAIIPGTPYDTSTQRKALERMAESVIAKGLNGDGPYRAARDLLQRIPPRLRNGTPGASLQQPDEPRIDAACRITSQLDRSYLPIQGPPGTGKTYTGAHLIIALTRAGHRVGITATSHKVITNLLDETCELAEKQGFELRALQKAGKDEATSDHGFVKVVSSNSDFQDAWTAETCHIAAGTAWLFSREDMFEKLHTLVIDEAGQFSLADALAVSGCAQNLVLLGDPQQLAQPSQGVHPPGSGASVLEHVLNGEDTIPDDHGLFLATTWRMHPNVCSFISDAFYDGRLESEPHTKHQRVELGGVMAGSGVHFICVEHSGNRVASAEEVKVIADLVRDLLKQTWINEEGQEGPIAPSDVLVVAPYNRQVAELRLMLPDEVPVGTVDKFQGQEGAVTIYSLTTSDPEDIPRNFEFLYSHNRLNVAISRARAISIVVGSPRLLQPRCGRPDQMRLANALCLYKETADEQEQQNG